MSRKALTRAAAAAAAALALGLVLAFTGARGAFAVFNGETQNNSQLAGGWVTAPTGISTPVASCNGQYFTWTLGTHGVAAQDIYFADQGSTSSCTGASYSNLLLTGLSTSTTSLDGSASAPSSNVPAANQGDYICYEIRSTNNTWYTAADITTAVQVGLVPTGFSSSTSGVINKHTNLTINFNHPINYSGASMITVTTNATTLTLPGIGTVSGSFGSSISCSGSGVTPGTSSIMIAVNCGGSTSATASGTGYYTGVSGSNVTASIGPAGHAYTVNQCDLSGNCKPQITW